MGRLGLRRSGDRTARAPSAVTSPSTAPGIPAGLNGLLGRREGYVDQERRDSCRAVQLAARHRRGTPVVLGRLKGRPRRERTARKPKACASRKSPSQPTASTGSTWTLQAVAQAAA